MKPVQSPYQKEIVYNKLLPYAHCLDDEATRILAEIKHNLGRAVALRELNPGGLHWCNRLFRSVLLLIKKRRYRTRCFYLAAYFLS